MAKVILEVECETEEIPQIHGLLVKVLKCDFEYRITSKS